MRRVIGFFDLMAEESHIQQAIGALTSQIIQPWGIEVIYFSRIQIDVWDFEFMLE